MLKERISKNLGIPYLYLPKEKAYLCNNGIVFTEEECSSGINVKEEFEKRLCQSDFYDYDYAKKTGRLKLKEPVMLEETELNNETTVKTGISKSIALLCLALTVTSIGSMWISTLHTATYLVDYFDVISSWIMSSIITLYASTAFEVVLLFWDKRRRILAVTFFILWLMVTIFSMVTTVSVFYDRFNFNTLQNMEYNKEADSNKLALELLKAEETALREEIDFKKKDIEFRREKDYATNARTLELNDLQNQLKDNLKSQRELLQSTPEVTKAEDEVKRKETFFDFLGRTYKINGSVIEFIISILSAVFINLIAPFTLSTVMILINKKE